MKLHRSLAALRRARSRSGAALLLSLLILLVLVAIVIQINVATGTDTRIARNDIALTTMDMAAESAMLQVVEMLKADGEAESSTGGAPGAAGPTGATGAASPTSPTAAAGVPGAGGAAGAQPAQQPCDSRRDEWATPQRTELNEIKLRIICQDENSKYNILNMLGPDEKESEAAFDRVVRILDNCREGTTYDIDQRTAEEMAKTLRDNLVQRKQSHLPRPKLLTDDDKKQDLGMPLTLREFMPLQPFEDYHFKDFRDPDGKVVHSITSFLTVWSSLSTAPVTAKNVAAGGAAGSSSKTPGSSSAPKTTGAASGSSSTAGRAGGTKPAANTQAGSGSTAGASGATGTNPTAGGTGAAGTTGATGQAGSTAGGTSSATPSSSTTGGYGVNVNTAPMAVLKALFDGREVNSRFWDEVVEYRNLEDEEETEKAKKEAADSGTAAAEPQLDEYGQPMITRRIFASISDLTKVDGYSDLSSEIQGKLNALLTTESEVFSVYVIARKTTSADSESNFTLTPAELRKREETRGDALLRVIHGVYWRHKQNDETKVTPVVRWEALDYLPYEVLDFPPDDR